MQIDLNADLGEGFGAYRMGDDEALLGIVSSANIACGFHAGDPVIMDRTVRMAGERGVAIGAHVGFPDLQGFGRRRIPMEAKELETMVLYQLGALVAIARAAGQEVTHVSFHGALGNAAYVDAALADAVVGAVASFNPKLVVSSLPGTQTERACKERGLLMARKFFADRAYDENGFLASRKLPGAVIKDPATVRARIAQVLRDGTVTTLGGKVIRPGFDAIMMHGDTQGAVDLARAVRQLVVEAGAEIVPMPTLVARRDRG